MSPEFLSVDEAIELHAELVERYGGSHGLRDRGLLESALSQPSVTFAGEYLHRDLLEMGAAYLFHVVEAHAFVDGNKRIGLQCMLVFLALNGIELDHGSERLYDLTMAVASGRGTKLEIVEVLRDLVFNR